MQENLPGLCADYNITHPAFAALFRREYNHSMPIDPQTRSLFPRVYDFVRQVPRGKVTTYGDVAQLVGQGCDARVVGYAMAACPDDIPWQRVINSQGKISLKGDAAQRQRLRLEAEGIAFDARGKIDLNRFRWSGPGGEFAPSQPSLFE
jgi:methylated-DNA-protein-cysteine methyltransferase-like protein